MSYWRTLRGDVNWYRVVSWVVICTVYIVIGWGVWVLAHH